MNGVLSDHSLMIHIYLAKSNFSNLSRLRYLSYHGKIAPVARIGGWIGDSWEQIEQISNQHLVKSAWCQVTSSWHRSYTYARGTCSMWLNGAEWGVRIWGGGVYIIYIYFWFRTRILILLYLESQKRQCIYFRYQYTYTSIHAYGPVVSWHFEILRASKPSVISEFSGDQLDNIHNPHGNKYYDRSRCCWGFRCCCGFRCDKVKSSWKRSCKTLEAKKNLKRPIKFYVRFADFVMSTYRYNGW